jgi:hypothetical protein
MAGRAISAVHLCFETRRCRWRNGGDGSSWFECGTHSSRRSSSAMPVQHESALIQHGLVLDCMTLINCMCSVFERSYNGNTWFSASTGLSRPSTYDGIRYSCNLYGARDSNNIGKTFNFREVEKRVLVMSSSTKVHPCAPFQRFAARSAVIEQGSSLPLI